MLELEPIQLESRSSSSFDFHPRAVFNLLRRRKGLIFSLFILVFLLGSVLTLMTQPVYESTVSLRVHQDQPSSGGLVDILRDFSNGNSVETELEVLRSRYLAGKVVDSLDLQISLRRPVRYAYDRESSRFGGWLDWLVPDPVSRGEIVTAFHAEPWAPWADLTLRKVGEGSFEVFDLEAALVLDTIQVGEPVTVPGATFTLTQAAGDLEHFGVEVHPFSTAVAALQSAALTFRPNREAGILRVRYESPDSQLVRLVPNAISAEFILERESVQKAEARGAVTFIQEQVDTLARELSAAEDSLQRYREGEQVVSLEQEISQQVRQLAALQGDRSRIEADRDALHKLLGEIQSENAARGDSLARSPYVRLMGFPTLFDNPMASDLLRSLTETETARATLLERRTPRDPDVQELSRQIAELEDQLRDFGETYVDGLTAQLTSLDGTLSTLGSDAVRVPGQELQIARLERERNVLEEIYTLLQTNLQQARIAEAAETPLAEVVDPAIRSERPIRPRRNRSLALWVGLGLAIGIFGAAIREYLDDAIHTSEDVQSATGGAPVLGMIPGISTRFSPFSRNGRPKKKTVQTVESKTTRRKNRSRRIADQAEKLEERLIAGRNPQSPVTEAYRSLRTNITFARPDDPPRLISVTSPFPRDGKSTTCANLAITLAQQGVKTLIVDADMRRGVLHKVFDLKNEDGLSDILANRSKSLGSIVQRVVLGDDVKLAFLSKGTRPPNPSELLGSGRMDDVLAMVRERYDTVLFDSPPLTGITDAAILGAKVDGVILVGRANKTPKGALRFARDQLRRVSAPLLGCVVNDINFKRDSRYYGSYSGYGYYYSEYYGERTS